MSGHSKWATTKHRKAAVDAKKGKIFTKLTKEITVSARQGGGDPDSNPRLRSAIAEAKSHNMPNDNIERAIKKGTGELVGVTYEEISYEGYGPGGVALIIEVVTDNRNRAIADMRHILARNGGNLGERGCVSWMFSKKGLIVVNKKDADEDDILSIALEAESEDVRTEDDRYEILTPPDKFELVKSSLEKSKIPTVFAQVSMIPNTTVKLEGKEAEQVLKLIEALEENDDIQNVYANFDIPDDLLDKAA